MKEASRNKFTDNSNLKSLTITQKKKGIFLNKPSQNLGYSQI